MKTSEGGICQSCGMLMNKITDFGSNKNRRINKEYCHFCYKDGAFNDPGITMEEKIEKNIAIAEKMGMPRDEAIAKANSIIPTLKRWKSPKKKS